MVDETVSVKLAEPQDARIVAEFIYQLIDELAAGDGPSLDAILETTDQVFMMDSVVGFIARDAEKPVGLVMLNECAAIYAGGTFGEISELYVAPQYRSKGIAARLITAAQHHAKAQKWKRLEVGAPPQPGWQRTMEFYLREGFDEVGPRLRKLV